MSLRLPTDDPIKTAQMQLEKAKQARDYHQQGLKLLRDIGEIPLVKNPRARAECRYNLRLFLERMYPSIFYMTWSADQLTLIDELEYRILHGGLKAVAMPRGGGKSSIVFGTTQWAIAYGHRHFIYVLKSEASSGHKFIESMRTDWETNILLKEQHPEISKSVIAMEGSTARGRLQTYKLERTHVDWKKEHINFPCLSGYDYGLDECAGSIVVSRGITGSFRGAQHLNPLTGEMMRPDFIILDDIQTDKTATSPTQIQKTIDLVDGAVKGLSPPGELIAGVMPCTVICAGDVSDQYLTQELKPEWSGMRCSMVISWPPGITDDVITDESRASRFWQEYANLRVQSLRECGDIHLSTEFYKLHREVMDQGFEVSWEERYNKSLSYEGNVEVSAQQHAMNLRLSNIFTFSAEYQNNPRKILDDIAEMPRAETIQERVVHYKPKIIPYYCSRLVAFIDVQDEMLWYTVVALSPDYTGVITDYGTFPTFSQINISKTVASKQRQLSREFFRAHLGKLKQRMGAPTPLDTSKPTKSGSTSDPNDIPEYHSLPEHWLNHIAKQIMDDQGRIVKMQKAPFEAKLTWALYQLVDHLFTNGRYMVEGKTPIELDYLGIDCRWGQAVDVVKRFICDHGDHRLVPYEGIYVGALSRTMSEYRRGDGAIFEDELHRDLGCCRWVARYDKTTRSRKLLSDVNAWKTFLVLNRLSCPAGSPGALMLHNTQVREAHRHPLLAQHLCKSEMPCNVTAKGKVVYEWRDAGQNVDNDWLDCLTGCMALASVAGCRIDDTPLSDITRAGTINSPSHKEGPDMPDSQSKRGTISPHEKGGKPKNQKPDGPRAHRNASHQTQQRRVKLSEIAARKAAQQQAAQLGHLR